MVVVVVVEVMGVGVVAATDGLWWNYGQARTDLADPEYCALVLPFVLISSKISVQMV